MSELVDVNIDRVDLVGKAANGHRFLLAKSESPNLIAADTVRDLIKDADAEQADPAALASLEDLTAVLKAGRALSSANESALRGAAEAIQKVLASLPAPEEAPVEKETPVAEETTEETAVEKTETAAVEAPVEDVVEKASMMAVYDATGRLVGAIKPSALTVIDAAPAAEEEAAESPEEETAEVPFEEAAADAPSDEVQPEDGAPVETAAEDETVIPGTETVQSPIEKGAAPETVTQAPDVAALLKELLAPLVEKIEAVSDLAGVVDVLKERVEAYGREPDDRNSPKLNGATGQAGIAKRGADTDDLTSLAKSVEIAKESGDPTKIANASQAYAFEAIKNRFQN
jgi:hypothetical protein